MGGIGMSKDVSYKNRDRFLELGLPSPPCEK